ncbi:MAG: hypothetical protein ACI974_001500, partial [Paraglaciecola sp.]
KKTTREIENSTHIIFRILVTQTKSCRNIVLRRFKTSNDIARIAI